MKRIGDATGCFRTQSDKRALARLLSGLERIRFSSGRGSALKKLCAAGVEYAWDELERTTEKRLLKLIGPKARTSLRRQLQKTLEQITGPSLELEWQSFLLAIESLGLGHGPRAIPEGKFLTGHAGDRLGSLFRKFPVLARLWVVAITQWCNHIVEVLRRFRKDASEISHCFFDDRPIGLIRNLRPGLSDPHHAGRSVTLVECEGGRLIYKPRSGRSEIVWFDLLGWMNRHGFQPKLRLERLLDKDSYSWMDFVEAASCKDEAGVRRFYRRLGGMIAAAYLLKAVDCHRENVIAAGEHPVLVDVDALWHVSPLTKTQSLTDVLYRTGFFPNTRRRSLQSRSSVLGWSRTGNHLARIKGRPAVAGDYVEEIVDGFSRGWRCLVGTERRRAVLGRVLRRIRAHPRRWIYLATETYATIRRASLSPAALRSEEEREALLTRLCIRSSVNRKVSQSEIKALRQLDLPYFLRTTNAHVAADNSSVPAEITAAIRSVLRRSRSGLK